ncbi:MAG: hypothetical protein JW860_16260, partial [Sedimentisphaerales bacterium]|nr:hypothetical protein [Sedimentisphaerales bacterium]
MKVRIGVVLGIAIILFATVGWSVAQPWQPGDPLVFMTHQNPFNLVLITIVLGVIATGLAVIAGGRYAHYMAPLALPAGLCTWSVITGSINRLLLVHQDISERASMFHKLAGEVILWFAIVLTGYLLVLMIKNFFASREKVDNPEQHMEDRSCQPLPFVPSEFEFYRRVYHHIRHLLRLSSPEQKRTKLSENQLFNSIMALVSTCILAALIIVLCAQSGTVP